MKGSLTVLGSGGSTGVPVIGCHCHICLSQNPLNKRLRPSIAIQIEGKTVLVDCGPDFRAQALARGIERVDALILTHTHFDHTAGIDDLRIFCLRHNQMLPCILSKSSFDDMQRRYYYLFDKLDESVVRFSFTVLEAERGVTSLFDLPLHYFTYHQNSMAVLGFRLGDFAYVTDIKQYEESLFQDLQGVKTLILSMQKPELSKAHFTLKEALKFVERVAPNRCYLNHMGHELDYEVLKKSLPKGLEPSFDGLKIPFEIVNG